jgi:ATP-dependent DNA helicase RecG
MDTITLINLIALGESSTVQFKRTFEEIEKITLEIAAFLNTNGGVIIIGVDDDKSILGVDAEKEGKLIQWISEASTDKHLSPPASVFIEKHIIEDKMIIVIDVPNGVNKPYQTKNKNLIYVKNGADKRIASVEELRRMLQSSDQIHSDEMPVNNTTIDDLNLEVVSNLLFKKIGKSIDDFNIPIEVLLENIGFMTQGKTTLAGLLIACENPQKFKPLFTIHCVRFDGNSITTDKYIDKENPFEGNLKTVFNNTISFIARNIKKTQVIGSSFNSSPEWIVPRDVFEELIVNALLHRDYFMQSTIKVMMFDDRIEIISPGKLPNSQTIEKIKLNSSVPRNPILVTNALHILPYSGVGSGIPRALSKYPKIELIDDRDKDLFIVKIFY